MLIRADSGNPHLIPPRIRSYDFFVFRKGRTHPYTLLYRRFGDTDARWLKAEPLRNLPHPLALSDRELVFRLPAEALQRWREAILVPDEDVVDVKELPFPRFPGAVLQKVPAPEDDDHLLEDRGVGRWYVVVGARIDDVIDHYQRVIQAYGVPVSRQANSGDLFWWGGEQSVKKLAHVTVSGTYFAPVPGSDLNLKRIRELAPDLLQDFPSEAIVFQVAIRFADVKSAVPYWPAPDQLRWKRLSERQEVERK